MKTLPRFVKVLLWPFALFILGVIGLLCFAYWSFRQFFILLRYGRRSKYRESFPKWALRHFPTVPPSTP